MGASPRDNYSRGSPYGKRRMLETKCASSQGGKRTLAYVDFADPGGMNTASLGVSPRATFFNSEINSR